MLEITSVRAGVITCLATEACLEGLVTTPGIYICRVAPGERLVLCAGEQRASVHAKAAAHIRRLDPDGVTVDQSDGWSVWMLDGSERDEVLARLSVLSLPRERPAFVMGAVAQVPARVLMGTRATCLMVPSPVGHHLEERMLAACGDLASELTRTAPFDISSLGDVATARGGAGWKGVGS